MRVQRPISFISEITAEYFLVPAAVKALSDGRTRALPFHFSSTREGSRVGIGQGAGDEARLVAIYARRPKVRYAGDDVVVVKFNHSLFEAAYEGHKMGIPVFAGVPIARSFFELSHESPRLWFHVNPEGAHGADVICSCSSVDPTSTFSGDEYLTMVPERALSDAAHSRSTKAEWAVWDERLRHFKRQTSRGRWFYSFGYRPFFVALAEDDR